MLDRFCCVHKSSALFCRVVSIFSQILVNCPSKTIVAPHFIALDLAHDITFPGNAHQVFGVGLNGVVMMDTVCCLQLLVTSDIAWLVTSDIAWLVTSDIAWLVTSDIAWLVTSDIAWLVTSDIAWLVTSDIAWLVTSIARLVRVES